MPVYYIQALFLCSRSILHLLYISFHHFPCFFCFSRIKTWASASSLNLNTFIYSFIHSLNVASRLGLRYIRRFESLYLKKKKKKSGIWGFGGWNFGNEWIEYAMLTGKWNQQRLGCCGFWLGDSECEHVCVCVMRIGWDMLCCAVLCCAVLR